jgi:hypothetical protein
VALAQASSHAELENWREPLVVETVFGRISAVELLAPPQVRGGKGGHRIEFPEAGLKSVVSRYFALRDELVDLAEQPPPRILDLG